MRKIALLLVFWSSFGPPVVAQPDVVYQPIEWSSLTAMIKVSKRVSILEEGLFRFVGNFQSQQYQYRTGVDIAISKSLSVMPIAYVRSWNFVYGKQPVEFQNNEHRIFEQIMYKHPVGRGLFTHRARLEQRFIEVHEVQNGDVVYKGYDNFVNRFRYRCQVNLPATDRTGPHTWYYCIYNEFFIDFGNSITYHEPDQNRFFAGVGYQFDKSISLQAGPIYQILIKHNGTQQENNLGLQLQVLCNFDLTHAAE